MASDLPPQQKPTRKPNYQERVRMGIQKGGLRPIAKNKIDLNKQYEKLKSEAPEFVECFCHPVITEITNGVRIRFPRLRKEFADPHHINGRMKENILDFKWTCRPSPAWIHANPNKARELGLLNF